MAMSRGLRPISFRVNETEKLWTQLEAGGELPGGTSVCFLLSVYPSPSSANILLKLQ